MSVLLMDQPAGPQSKKASRKTPCPPSVGLDAGSVTSTEKKLLLQPQALQLFEVFARTQRAFVPFANGAVSSPAVVLRYEYFRLPAASM